MHSLHKTTSDNGSRLINFAASREFVISSTCFPHKNIHKGTWLSPKNNVNQIDHVLVDSRHASNVMDVRSHRGPNIDSDHFLVIAKVRARISIAKSERRQEVKGYNIEALKSADASKTFASKVTQQLMNVQTDGPVEELWKQGSSAIITAATEVLGPIRRKSKKEWFDAECEEAMRVKNAAREKWLSARKTRGAGADIERKYKDARRQAVHLCRKKKRFFEESEMRKVELLGGRSDIRKFYQHVKRQREGYAPPTTFCNDAAGNLLVNDADVLERWREYFAELLGGNIDETTREQGFTTTEPTSGSLEEIPTPSKDEIKAAIRKLKRNKSPGSDGIPAELIKSAGDSFTDYLYQLFQRIWSTLEMPSEWSLSMITPIYKKGDKKECKNYRGISVLNAAYKILSFILCERLKPYLTNIIGSYQCGFRPGKSTTDQIFTLRQILEKTREFQIDTHHLFIDFKQAYDSIIRDELYTAMNQLGIPKRLILLCQMTLADTKSAVRMGTNASQPFTTTKGFRQGDALSCDLFNICLEIIVRRADTRASNNIFTRSTQLLGYADDIDIVSRNVEDMKNSYINISSAAKTMGLIVNVEKTKYLKSSRDNQPFNNITIGGDEFEAVNDFTYLGSSINTENDITLEIKRRIMLANRTLYGLSKILRSKFVRRNTKLKIYKTLIIPVLMYGVESWTLSESDKNMLGIFERKVLRMIFGPVCVGNEWRIRYNQELYQLYKDTKIVDRIRKQQLRWLGHVWRMQDDEPPKKIAFAKPTGRRKQGGQKLRWLDCIEKQIAAKGINNWKTLAVDRQSWRDVIDRS